MSNLSLPPGFRFHPTDEELILCYLTQKLIIVNNSSSSTTSLSDIIAEVDIYKFDPWDLPGKAAFGEKEWYFFSHRDRKYPNGARPNRAAASGYWKATGTDKHITRQGRGRHNVIGVKKSLVFYTGRPPKGLKTSWIMHEYRLPPNTPHSLNHLPSSSITIDDWVLCRIYKKPNAVPHATMINDHTTKPVLQEPLPQKSSSFSDLFNAMDYSLLTSFFSDHPIIESNSFHQHNPQLVGFNHPDQSIFNNNSNSNSTINHSSGTYANQPFLNQHSHIPLQFHKC